MFTDEDLKPYGYAAGHYMVKCADCGDVDLGLDKRATVCRSCGVARAIDALRAENARLLQSALATQRDADKLLDKLHAAEREIADAKREAESLALSMHKRYYAADSPQFELCDTVAGVITQIDNMVAGLAAKERGSIDGISRADRLRGWLEDIAQHTSCDDCYAERKCQQAIQEDEELFPK